MGFLVICAGITLLQMSKIDPSDLKLDRRSTILLSAAKAETTGNEKGAGLEYEDPGIDALRGTAGAIGSIYRARSARRSIASQKSGSEWRRRHTASTQPNTLSTVGMGALPRHQLYDKVRLCLLSPVYARDSGRRTAHVYAADAGRLA